jgi:hypothetical protein
MNQRKKDRQGASRLALISLLAWFSCHEQQQQQYEQHLFVGAIRSNGPSIQHRVKRSRRSVDYGFSRRTSASYAAPVLQVHVVRTQHKNNIRSVSASSSSSATTAKRAENDNYATHNLRRELHPGEDAFWVFGASGNSDQTTQQQQEYHNINNNKNDSRRSLLRYLYDQFVGEELPPSELLSSTTTSNINVNVTAEVEFESIVETNTNQTFFHHDADNTYNVINSNSNGNNTVTTTTTAVVGNSTNTTGNITESVVYTTVNNEDAIQSNGGNDASTNEINNNNVNTNANSNSNGSYGDGSFGDGSNATENNGNSTIPQEDELLLEPQFQPLRMRAILVEDSGNGSLLTDTEREILFYEMLSPALLAWSSSLRVDPVVGNLTVDVHQLLDGQTCGPGIDSGLPSIRVPLQHLNEGIPETDMIVYLSLGFPVPNGDDDDNDNETNATDSPYYTDSNWTSDNEDEGEDEFNNANFMQSKREEPRGGLFGSVKDRWNRKDSGGQRRRYLTTETSSGSFRDLPPSSTTSSVQNNNNSSSAETNETTTTAAAINICTGGDYLAAASYCSTDQYDRPTAALLHICIDDNFFDPKHLQRNIMTIIHELGHALGFNALSMAHFRRPDGTPYTLRDDDGNIPDSTIECTGPEDEPQIATLPLPSEEILQFRNVRGGVRVAEIVTPSVLQVVRNQFDCQLLTGAELESSEGSPLSLTIEGAGCIGDHWERRLFSSDVMNPIVDDIEYSTRISTLTLAYFADSGWYQVDLSNADVASGWGRGAGCNFVNDTCINEFGDVPPQNAPFFCNEVSDDRIPGLSLAQNIHGCTPDLSRKAKCSIGQYDLDLPKAYQYFNSTYGSDVGGSDILMDFCPVYDGYDNGMCSSPESETVIRANEVERFGLRNSRCLVGNVFPFYRNMALCLPIACVLEDRSLRIKVGENWHICEFADQSIQSGSVNITCPDPRRICPTFFCPYDCLGTGGECDYKSGKCLCQYENATHPEEKKVLDKCGIKTEEIEEYEKNRNSTRTSSATTLRPILQLKGKKESMMPPSDTKLSEYYVSDVLHLDDRPHFMDAWGILVLSVTILTLVSFFVALLYWKRKGPDPAEDEDGIGRDENFHGRTRDKHKMVASVLVDMRIRESDDNNNNTIASNWRRRRRGRDINESVAETDGRMTDSDIASSAPPAMSDDLNSLSDVSSSRQMMMDDEAETMSDLEGDLNGCINETSPREDDGEVDLLSAREEEAEPPALQQQPAVIRRRRFVPNLFA